MKDKEKQIEELADTLEYLCFADTVYDEDDNLIPNYKGIADELINKQGYRKIDKDSVVLSMEEYEEYQRLIKLFTCDSPISKRVYNLIKDIKEQTRKQTAREILRELVDKLKDNVNGNNVDYFVKVRIISDELAKQYGAEI